MQEPIPESKPENDYYDRRPSDLRPLADLPGWQVVDGEPNIGGWVVYDEDNERPIGAVEDLLVSIEMAQAVFIILNTGDIIGEDGIDYYGADSDWTDRRVLVPLDRIELDKPDQRVLLLESLDRLHHAPDFEPGTTAFDKYYDYWQAA